MNQWEMRDYEREYGYEVPIEKWDNDDWLAWQDARLAEIDEDFIYCFNRVDEDQIEMLAYLLQNCEALVIQMKKDAYEKLYDQFIEWAKDHGVSWIPF